MSCLGKAMWDGSVGRECGPAVWDGGVGLSVGRRCGPAVWESIPFWQIFAVWVEIYDRRQLDSLPFSAVSRCLGRDFQPTATGISTLSADFPDLGRDLHPAALGFSTLFGSFPLFG